MLEIREKEKIEVTEFSIQEWRTNWKSAKPGPWKYTAGFIRDFTNHIIAEDKFTSETNRDFMLHITNVYKPLLDKCDELLKEVKQLKKETEKYKKILS